jgi:outer membrane protein OmpA-like peptidoglycan-associated protein
MLRDRKVFVASALSLAIAALGCAKPALAGWQDTSKINKWFEDQQKKTYTIQNPGQVSQPTAPIQTPGKIQEPKALQIPRGIKAIRQVDKNCEHRFVVGADTLFQFDKWNLTPQAEETLKVLGPMIEKESNHPISIEGHTDSIGTVDYNQQLSEKRAATVNQWLMDHKFLPGSAAVSGYGKSRPIAANTNADGSDNPAGRQKNRRVEIVVDTCNTAPLANTPKPGETAGAGTAAVKSAPATQTPADPATGAAGQNPAASPAQSTPAASSTTSAAPASSPPAQSSPDATAASEKPAQSGATAPQSTGATSTTPGAASQTAGPASSTGDTAGSASSPSPQPPSAAGEAK